MPCHQSFGRYDRGNLCQKLLPYRFGLRGEPAALMIAQPQSSFRQVAHGEPDFCVKLTLVHPTSDGDEDETEWIKDIRHSYGSLSRALLLQLKRTISSRSTFRTIRRHGIQPVQNRGNSRIVWISSTYLDLFSPELPVTDNPAAT
jgi:hypothetical protein